MAQTYTRQSSIADGDTITAALFNNEYNQLLNAFAYSSSSASSTGHRHDGSTAQGGNIYKIGDLDFLNKIEADSTNNRWGIYVEVSSAAVEQIRIQDGAIVPVTDNDIDLGTSSLEFKDAYFDGTVTSDAFAGPLTGDVTGNVSGTAATVTTAAQSNITSLGTLTTLTVDNVIVNGTTIGHTSDTDLMTLADGVLTVAGEVSMTTLDIGGTNVTSTAAELNILDGVTSTAAELNIMDGDTSATSTTLADADRVVVNDGGTMKQVALTDFETYFESSIDTIANFEVTTELQTPLIAFTDGDDAIQIADGGGVTMVAGLTSTASANSLGATSFNDADITNVGDIQLDSITGDGDTNTSITFSGSDVITIAAGGDNQVTFTNGAIVPSTDNDIDLGTSSTEFKDAYFDGTVTTDALVADTADINGGTVDGAIIGGASAAAITGTAITGTSFVIGSADINEAELETIDGVTAGTVAASKAVVVDSNKDIGSFRNITLTGELDAATLDISGDADIDGTLEADAITIGGVTLAETISDTVGAMVTSNTETGVTVTYDDSDNTLDFVIGTLNQDTTGTAAVATTVTITDNESTNENNAIVFTSGGDLDGGNLGLESDGDLKYNPSTGTLSATNISVSGTFSTVNSVTMNANNAVVFEGSTADAHETTLSSIDATGDRTINLPNVSGTLPVLAAASATQISSTPEELNILDGATVVVGEINALDLGSTAVGTAIASKAVILDSNKDYTGIRNLTITGELDGATLDISGDADIDGTTNLDVVDIDGAVDMATTLAVAGNVDFNGDLDVDGTTNLDVVDIDGAVDMASTLAVSGLLTANANITLAGTTPTLTIGDAGAEDTKIVFDGNAQDFYIGLDDSADDLIIGKGSTVGTTPAISIDEDLHTTLGGDLTATSSTTNKPVVTIKNTNADATAPQLAFNKDSASPADNDELGRIYMYGDDDAGNSTEAVLIRGIMTDVSNGSEDSTLEFFTQKAGSQTSTLTLASGNAGIGGAPATAAGLSQYLTIYGGDAGIALKDSSANDTVELYNAGGKLHVYGGTGGSNGDRFVLDCVNTRLGIGITSPGHPLHIAESADGTKIRLNRAGIAEWDFSIGDTSTLSGVGSGALELLPQNGGTANEFAIGTAGGTQALFHLSASATVMPKKLLVGVSSVTSMSGEGIESGGSLRVNNFILSTDLAGTGFRNLNSTSNGTITNSTSLRELKENIVDISLGLSDVLKLKPREFDWKDAVEHGTQDIGFIADEVFDVSPKLATYKVGDKTKNNLQGVKYDTMTSLLVKAIQEQQTIIDDLKSRIKTLEDA